MRPDILYIVGEHSEWRHQELRYSLRSLKNMEHASVTISGTMPSWVKDVAHVQGNDTSSNRAENVQRKILAALDQVGDKVIVMWDDIYIMEPWNPVGITYLGPLANRITNCGKRIDQWSKSVRATMDLCKSIGFHEPLDCGTHHPHLYDRDELREVVELSLRNGAVDFTTLYGAICSPMMTKGHNAKVKKWEGSFDKAILSSSPRIEKNTNFRAWINARFPEKSPYER